MGIGCFKRQGNYLCEYQDKAKPGSLIQNRINNGHKPEDFVEKELTSAQATEIISKQNAKLPKYKNKMKALKSMKKKFMNLGFTEEQVKYLLGRGI